MIHYTVISVCNHKFWFTIISMIEHALFHKISIHIITYQKPNNSSIRLLNLKNIRMRKMHICPSTTFKHKIMLVSSSHYACIMFKGWHVLASYLKLYINDCSIAVYCKISLVKQQSIKLYALFNALVVLLIESINSFSNKQPNYVSIMLG